MKLKADQPIGIFDSGVGGLTIAHAIKSLLPQEKIIYFGDTFHLPYGDKSSESVRYYSCRISDFLLEKNCKTVLIACNTASSSAFNASDLISFSILSPSRSNRWLIAQAHVAQWPLFESLWSGSKQPRQTGLYLVSPNIVVYCLTWWLSHQWRVWVWDRLIRGPQITHTDYTNNSDWCIGRASNRTPANQYW